jgi:hypothetical protein
MDDPDLVYAEILASIERNVTGRGSMMNFEPEVKNLLNDFYNDVYEEGFTDGYDQGSGDSTSKANSDAGWELQNARDRGEDSGREGDW